MAFRDIDRTKPLSAQVLGLKNKSMSSNLTSAEDDSPITEYDAPGGVDDFDSEELKAIWNRRIVNEFEDLSDYHSRFFAIDSTKISDGNDTPDVRWAADPAEPNFCFGIEAARELSNWRIKSGHPVHSALSSKGRRETHNEYCEYRIIFHKEEGQPPRAKRVVFTTELREYWMTLATYAPDRLKCACYDVLGRDVDWTELYGPGVEDPSELTENQRLILFATWVSGGGGDRDLMEAGVPIHPIGELNNLNALFMTHRINGLDDLLYIVLYGAHPYARKDGSDWVPATKDEIFSKTYFEGEELPPIQLACRHADPEAATKAAKQAFEGRKLGFANPLGMYIMSFADADFLFQGNTLPSDWIRFSRGSGDQLYQRLEFGPPDDSPHFLDEITVGDDELPVQGGFEIAQRIEVGPWLRIGSQSDVTDDEYERFEVEALDEDYDCAKAPICRKLTRLRDEYEEAREDEI
ncbi:hypothetical protein [Sphingorhabdus sp. Alg231-15]|uniref:hypothetical protein n=1 Tax=Sphingorhabdus sp. Alg231-15 TaxID=1922222 RepID=UPI000D55BB63